MQTLTINKFHKEYFERLRKEVQAAKTKQQMNDVLGEVYVMLNTFLIEGREVKKQLYKHHKGNIYEYKCAAMLETDCEVHAVYESVKDGKIWVRPMDEFDEKFKLIK